MTATEVFRVGVKLLGVYLTASGIAHLVQALAFCLDFLMISNRSSTWVGVSQIAAAAAYVLVGIVLIKRTSAIMRWCGLYEANHD